MTILATIQAASMKLGIERPAVVMSSTEQEHLELKAVANEMAEEIGKAAEWELLKKLHTFTGDGSETEFDLPADFDRMPKEAQLRSTRWDGGRLEHVESHDDWLSRQLQNFTDFGAWTKLSGQIHFNPAPTDTELVKFYYLSNGWITGADGPTFEFLADDDVFRLPERLIRLGIIWKWKKDKGTPYAEELADYEIALAAETMRDKGVRTISIGRASWPRGVDIAYPGVISE